MNCIISVVRSPPICIQLQYKIQMSYNQIDDSGQFNESTVFLQPVRFTQNQKLSQARHNNLQQTNLGIYENIKLSQYIKKRQGKVVELVHLDPNSNRTFVSEEGQQILRQYPSNQIALAVVIGNKKAGKSFLLDKILNLSQIRGNHFCRKDNVGINIWSTPFEKDDLKIFLVEISGCDIGSQHFSILLTYSIMLGSAFIVVQDFKSKEQNAMKKLDTALNDIIDRISPSKMQKKVQNKQNRDIFLPQLFFLLKRSSQKKEQQQLVLLPSFIEEILPNAKAASFEGKQEQLHHIPFLDVKCVNQNYIKKISQIFTQLYKVISQKRYKDITLNGSIIIKILKYTENYINNNLNVSIEQLYQRIIEDLYQSAYNYCLLSYHQEMQKQLQDELPKSFDQLLNIFERANVNVIQRFQQFNLDDSLHEKYLQKLYNHIDEKQLMIIDVNRRKTERVLQNISLNYNLKDYQGYNSFLNQIHNQKKYLNHQISEEIGRVTIQFLKSNNSGDQRALKQIQRLKGAIEQSSNVLKQVKAQNDKKLKEKMNMSKKQQQLFNQQKILDQKKKQILATIQKLKNVHKPQSQQLKKSIQGYEQGIRQNNILIQKYKTSNLPKSKEIAAKQSQIEETKIKIIKLESLLSQVKSIPAEASKTQQKKPTLKQKGKQARK